MEIPDRSACLVVLAVTSTTSVCPRSGRPNGPSSASGGRRLSWRWWSRHIVPQDELGVCRSGRYADRWRAVRRADGAIPGRRSGGGPSFFLAAASGRESIIRRRRARTAPNAPPPPRRSRQMICRSQLAVLSAWPLRSGWPSAVRRACCAWLAVGRATSARAATEAAIEAQHPRFPDERARMPLPATGFT